MIRVINFSNVKKYFFQIFVAFSENLNFIFPGTTETPQFLHHQKTQLCQFG